jgi:GntR family transcriptional regulator
MQVSLDRRSDVPLYRQLVNELREQIVAGRLAAGYRLPSEREMAELLAVNRTTVLQAYSELKDDGLIASHVGKGTFVQRHANEHTIAAPATVSTTTSPHASPALEPSTPGPSTPSPQTLGPSTPSLSKLSPSTLSSLTPSPLTLSPPWPVLFSDYSNRFTYHDIASADRAQSMDGVIDFATGSPNPHDIPDDLLRDVSLHAFSSHDFDGQPESPIEGFPELCTLLADHMREDRMIHCSPRNVMVLSGSEQGLDLCVRAFVNPDDCVLVESSTFFPALHAFRSADARIIGVPTDESGMRTELLEGFCARFHPKLIYTIPTFHNPTGSTMPAQRRRELIETAMKYQCLVIEDDPYGELHYGTSAPPTPLKGMENAGYVIYLSTFSKTVTPGLRTGWLIADTHVVARLAALRRMVDQHTSSSSQRICIELLRGGRIRRHIEEITGAYRMRRDAMCNALQRYAPPTARWSVPEGGYYVWLSLPEDQRSQTLLEAARPLGVTFMPGGVFDVDGTDTRHIRLNFVRPRMDQISDGIRLLCAAMRGDGRRTA